MKDENGEILAALSKQVAELREMNVRILRDTAFIQAALNTLLTLHAEDDPQTMEIYRAQVRSMRATITAALEHLGLQKAMEEFLSVSGASLELLRVGQAPELKNAA